MLERIRRARWSGYLAWLALALVIVAGLRWWQQRELVAGAAPALAAETLGGGGVELTGAAASGPILVYFWASWCPVCRLEQGAIDTLARERAVITVAMQSGDDGAVRRYLAEHGLRMPVINDPQGALAAQWGVRATPTLFVVDRHGVIRFREVGYTTEAGLRLRLWWAGL